MACAFSFVQVPIEFLFHATTPKTGVIMSRQMSKVKCYREDEEISMFKKAFLGAAKARLSAKRQLNASLLP